MLTIFAACRPFEGVMNDIQRNAIRTWQELPMDDHEVILIGNEAGIADAARDLGVRHVPVEEEYLYGTFSIPEYERLARKHAKGDMLLQISADVILLSFFEAFEALSTFAISHPKYIGVGRRWDAPYLGPIDFEGDWRRRLCEHKEFRGQLHPECGLDVIVFPASSEPFFPHGLIGRPRGDGGIFHLALHRGMVGVEITNGIVALHQEHEPWGDREEWQCGTDYNQSHIHQRVGGNHATHEIRNMQVRRRGE